MFNFGSCWIKMPGNNLPYFLVGNGKDFSFSERRIGEDRFNTFAKGKSETKNYITPVHNEGGQATVEYAVLERKPYE